MTYLTLVTYLKRLSKQHLVSAFAALSIFIGIMPAAKAAADGEKALWIGAAGGAFVPNKSSTTARSMMGVTAGAKIGTEMGIGAYYFTTRKDEGAPIGKFDLDFYGIEGTYHFEGEAKGAYFGVRLGIAKMDFGLAADSVSASPFHAGLIAGYNYWITDALSIGGDVSFYSVSKGEATALSGRTNSVDSFSALGFLATLKLWL